MLPLPKSRFRGSSVTVMSFGTIRPTHAVVEDRLGDVLTTMVGRGECVYVPIYEGERAVELLFAGCSYD